MKKKSLFFTMILMAIVFISMPKVEALNIDTPEALASYLNATKTGDTITLNENATIGNTDYVYINSDLIIDLNGYTLTTNPFAPIAISTNAIIKNGTINGGVAYWETLTIENATITELDGQAQSSTIIKGITTLNESTNGNMTIENGATLIVNSNDFRFKYHDNNLNGHLLTNNGTILIKDNNSVFTIDSGNNILNNGIILNNGTFTNNGTLASASTGRIVNNPRKIEKLAMTNGSIDAFYYVGENDTATLTIEPNTGYRLKNGTLKVMKGDMVEVPLTKVNDTTYTFTMPSADVTVFAEFEKIPYTITINNVDNATITPNGVINVVYGDNKDITITANIGYKLKSVKVNNVEKLSTLSNNVLSLTDIQADTTINIEVEKIVYEVLEGKDQTHTIGTDNNIVIKIDADKNLFSKLFINEIELGTDKYEITSGSTIITLKKSYLDSLDKGTYDLKAIFTDGGESTTSFTIAKLADNPKTGDSIITSIILGSISLIGLLGASIYLKKKRFN